MNPGKYVVFGLGEERYGLPIENVEQILKSSRVTRLPNSPREMLGLFSLRGSTVPVLDAGQILGTTAEDRDYFLVVSIDNIRASFLVDQVHKIADLTADQIEPMENENSEGLCSHCAKTEDGLIVLLTPDACLGGGLAKAIRKKLVA